MKKVIKIFIISIIVLFLLIIFLAFILPFIKMNKPLPVFNYDLKQASPEEPYKINFSADEVNIKGATHFRVTCNFDGKEEKTALTKIGNCTDPIEIPKDIFSIPIASIEIYNENKCIQKLENLDDVIIPHAKIDYSKPQLNPSKGTKKVELIVACNTKNAIYYKILYKLNEKEETTALTLFEYTCFVELPIDTTKLFITALEVYGENKEEPLEIFRGFDDIELTDFEPEK